MLNYNEIKEKRYIEFEGEPYEVLSSNVFRKQQRKPVNATKLKNLINGKVVEQSFHVSDKVEEADLEYGKVKYLYENKGEYWFCEENDPSKRFSLPFEVVGESIKFIKENSLVDTLIFNEKIIGIKVPIKVKLKVKEAPPVVRGNTAQGVTKQVVVETGAIVIAPGFINENDLIEVNTETSEYTKRIE